MTAALALDGLDEHGVSRIAELVALKVAPGDAIALSGDLGAGKTTFARALIRALLGTPEAEVPSPTFPIVQPYAVDRLPVAHFDFYRLAGAQDLVEVGYDEAIATGLAIIEWPERAAEVLPENRLEVRLDLGDSLDHRRVTLVAHGTFVSRLERIGRILGFLASPPTGEVERIAYLQGDASARAYARITIDARSWVLMDAPRMPDGPPVRDGLPYSRIAHLAEDVRPFVAVGRALEAHGMSVPHIQKADLECGLLLVEDLGETTFARALAAGVPQATLWGAAVDVLIDLRRHPLPEPLPLGDGSSYRLPRFDRAALEIELALILDWYWPEATGGPAPAGVRDELMSLWSPVLDRLLAEPPGLFLRDYHSPNLFWLPDRPSGRRVGVIDFQDAMAGPWALDLVSLLQDARIDVPTALEAAERKRYIDAVSGLEPDFDRDRFLATYAAFGAQRNTRLIGLWIRLLRRDGKPGYLQHMARTWDYLGRNLEHPELADLRSWYARHFPEPLRSRPIVA
ncbi:MAG: tRNA (adenosine(37)-N6)-threonylcarbamoyltransferase complex ATPase subunit type 1 TsaE [Hyphomicrobiaceae bacterium]|nr:tRNA (adenosine(37)-N6)-threonylcarbamoyltransferase complex ATPase subunit type 1 TsaE [Hyphomicrobiaceae bacterium]